MFTNERQVVCFKSLNNLIYFSFKWISIVDIAYIMQLSVSSKTIPPRDMTRRGQKPSPGTIMVYKNKTGSQKPYPWDINLEIFQ